jgi:hypothetical protein
MIIRDAQDKPICGLIPTSNMKSVFAVVDIDDYEWAMQWKWKAQKSQGTKVKWYLVRTTRLPGRRNVKYWLHKEICTRAHGLPPSPKEQIADHEDGESLNCRRTNLRWTDESGNRRNLHGVYAQQLRMAFKTGDMSRVITRAEHEAP